jgi:hypothetical protein
MRTQDVLALAEQSRAYHQSNVSLVFLVDFAKRVAAAECERICSAIKAEPVQEPVAWSGYDLDGMVEAFSRVIEAHHSSKHPFHNPIDTDAKMALRILRGFIPSMKAYAAPPQRKPLTEEEIDAATAQERDALLDHIYEYGTAAEGVLERIRKLCRAAAEIGRNVK